MNTSRVLGGGLLLAVLIPSVLLAAEFRAGDQPNLPQGQAVDDDLYMAGGNVSSSGDVRGDLSAAGGSILVNGPVTGDLMAAGGNITLSAVVGDDMRVAGGNVAIQGSVGGDVLAAGGQLQLSGEWIRGDAWLAGGTVSLDTPVEGDVQIAGGQIRINAPIRGSLKVEAEEIVLGPNAVVTGDFTYSAPKAAEIQEGAQVQGATNYTPRESVSGAAEAVSTAFLSFWAIARFLMTLTGAMLLAYLFPRYVRELVDLSASEPLKEIARGLIVMIVLPVLSVLLFASIIGIPLGVLGILTLIALSIFASFVAPILLGAYIWKWAQSSTKYEVNWKTVLTGVAVYFLLSFIPLIGWLVKFVLILLAVGVITNMKWRIAKEWRSV